MALHQDLSEELTGLMGNPEGGPTEFNWAKRDRPSSRWSVCKVRARRPPSVSWRAGCTRFISANHYRRCRRISSRRRTAASGDRRKTRDVGVYRRQENPVEICDEAYKYAYTKGYEVVLLDTAGRLAIDEPLMRELDQIKSRVKPQEVFLVVDSMIGQDAVNTARTFHDRVSTTGFILTKLDGDARGGAALTIREVTGQPIRFLGVGESLDKIEEFRPEGWPAASSAWATSSA